MGEDALNGFRLQGAYGPSRAGKTLFGAGIFRRNMMECDLVPQLTLIHLLAPWPKRMVTLSAWHHENGDQDGCEATIEELLRHIPDFAQRYPDLGLDCLSAR